MSQDDPSTPESAEEASQERASRRAKLPIPMSARVGAAPSRKSRLHDVSVSGFRIEWPEPAEIGEAVIVRFEGYPSVCPAFILHGRVARMVHGEPPGLGIVIDRDGTPEESLQHLRRLVLHYMRHKPLLEEVVRDFFEGRCETCDWIGRLGSRSPVCPRCGEPVRSLDPDQ